MATRIVPISRASTSVPLGLTLVEVKGNHVITAVAPNSPAKIANCIVGSNIIGVDGRDMSKASHSDLVGALGGKTSMVLKLATPLTTSSSSRSERTSVTAPSTPTRPAQPSALTGLFSPVRRVRVTKAKGASFGFTILDAQKEEMGGLQEVVKVVETSAAKVAGVKQNDVILSINGASLIGKNHAEVLQALKAAGNQVELELQQTVDLGTDDVDSADDLPITITRGTVDRSGFSSLGVKLEEDPHYAGLRIEELVPGLPFANAGVFKVGDVLVELNGHFVLDDFEAAEDLIPLFVEAGESFVVGVATEEDVNSIREPLPDDGTDGAAEEGSTGVRRVVLTRRAGMGIGLKLEDAGPGARIGGVNPGTTAAEAMATGQIRAGDLILAVNGSPSAHLGLAEVVRLFNGGGGGGASGSAGSGNGDSELVLMLKNNNSNNNNDGGDSGGSGSGNGGAVVGTSNAPATNSVRSVTLDRTEGRLGMSLMESVNGYPMLLKLSSDGVAAKSGQLSEGMLIVSANGQSLKGNSLQSLLAASPSKKVMLVVKDASDVTSEVPVEVTLSVTKAPAERLGVRITQSEDANNPVCYLHEIDPNLPFGRAGAQVDDVVLRVNGVNLTAAGNSAVVGAIVGGGSAFEVVVKRIV